MNTEDSNIIYMDYAASTPVDPRVLEAMEPFWNQHFANAGSLHREGRLAKETLNLARFNCAEVIGAKQDEIIFTGSGTESNNIAILGAIKSLQKQGMALKDMHIVTSSIEHPSVLDCFKEFEESSVDVTYLPVKESGRINPAELKSVIKENTVLFSVMYVNNEMGAIQPIEELSRVIAEYRKEHKCKPPYLHVDASQAAMVLPIDVEELGIDYMTLDAQKIYGPKGVGLLYRREHAPLEPVIIGGNQEFGLRPSTENIPGIVGMKTALEIVRDEQEREVPRLTELRDYCIAQIREKLPSGVINGPLDEGIRYRMANNINVSFPNVEGEFLVIALSDRGFACGTRSACITGGGPSYVVTAMGRRALANNSLRISLGRYSTKEHIDKLIIALKELVQ